MDKPTVASVTADLIAEQDALDAVVAPLATEDWERATPSPRWAVRDQIGHLAFFDMIDGILTAIHEAENDDQIGAVVVHGREGKFSAGFDLGVMMADDQSAIVNLVANGGELVRTLYGCSVPVVAASTGHALAAGALMLLGCDVRVGADVPAKVGLNEVAIKMVLPDWALTIAGARLSKRHMQRSIVNARITSPADAVDVGFLDEVVPADELLDLSLIHI